MGEKIITEFDCKRVENAVALSGKSVNQLHKDSGLKRASISSYINGDTVPLSDNLAKLADALDVEDINYFFIKKRVSIHTQEGAE